MIDGEDPSKEGMSHFMLGRARLSFNYSRSWLEAKVALQQAGTWGMSGGSFSINEAWVGVKSPKGWFAKMGRQVLAYDDERIIGTNDWSVTREVSPRRAWFPHGRLHVQPEGRVQASRKLFGLWRIRLPKRRSVLSTSWNDKK